MEEQQCCWLVDEWCSWLRDGRWKTSFVWLRDSRWKISFCFVFWLRDGKWWICFVWLRDGRWKICFVWLRDGRWKISDSASRISRVVGSIMVDGEVVLLVS